jgi:hypothetical protein
MADIPLAIFNDITARRSVAGSKNAGSVAPLVFFQEDNIAMEIQFLKANPAGGALNPYSIVPVAGLSLTVKIGLLSAGTINASQTVWTADTINNILTGTLNLNTAQTVADFTAGVTQIDRTLEFQLSDSVGTITSLQIPVTIKKELIVAGNPVALPLDQYYTRAEMDALYVKFVNDPGKTITLTSLTTGRQRILGENDDGTAQDDQV